MYVGSNIKKGLPEYTPPDSDLMGSAFWGNMPNGTPIGNMDSFLTKAQDRFIAQKEANSDFEYVPLVNPFPDSIVKSAIYGYNQASSLKTSQEIFQKAMTPFHEMLLKQYAVENPESEIGQEIQKAVSTGSSMMHIVADQDVTLLYKRPYPIQALIPVESNIGYAAHWDIIPPFGFNSASFGSEDPTLIETDFSSSKRYEYVKYMYAVGRVTKGAKFAGLTQYPTRDLKTLAIDSSQEALRALRERSILGVTRDVSNIDSLTFTDATDLEYRGLYEIITNNTSEPNYVTSTGDDYDSIMGDLRSTYRNMIKDGMRPNLALCDIVTFDTIAAGLMEYFRTEPIKEFTQGISKISLVFQGAGGLPLVPTEFLPTADGSRGIFALDTKLLSRRVLWQDMYEDLAKINTSDKFVISAAEVLIDKTDENKSGSTTGGKSLHGGVFGIGA